MSTQFSGLTDKELDDAYAAAYDSHDPNAQPLMVALADEIISRVDSPLTALSAFFGGAERFPQYDARTRFNPTDTIRSAAVDHAGQVASGIGSTIGKVLSPSAIVLIPLAVIAVVLLINKYKG